MIPIQHWPNHEIALITKFFEYSHARLPLVVSDVRTMAETVRETGQGEVFEAEDVADFVRAVTRGARRPGALPCRVRPARVAGRLDLGGAGRGAGRRLLPAAARRAAAPDVRPRHPTGAEQTVVEVGA